MNVLTLDMIVKNMLMKRRYPLHHYIEFLVYAKDALREFSFDLPLETLRYKVLVLNDNHALDIPDDYTDFVNVGARVGQYIVPLVEDNGLDLVPNYDSSFNIQPYSQGVQTDQNQQLTYYNGWLTPYWFMVNWNTFGENMGRQFGGISIFNDTFKVNTARNEIKINENCPFTEYVLQYIGNGIDADSATHINAYCQAAIEAYMLWQFKENNRTYSEGEAQVAKQDYNQEYLRMRARFSDITLDRLKRITQRNSISIKY